jgi:hypothetical protein
MSDNSTVFSVCMRRQCSGSEPTLYNPEVFFVAFCSLFLCSVLFHSSVDFSSQWPKEEVGFDHPLLRLDYILMSRNLFQSLHPSSSSSASSSMIPLKAGIEINNITSHLSDHFPVYASFIPPEMQQLHGHCDVSSATTEISTSQKQEQSCRIELFQ